MTDSKNSVKAEVLPNVSKLTFGDLRMSHVAEHSNTCIKDFIILEAGRVILNPNGSGEAIVDDVTNAIDYLSAGLMMVTQYAEVTKGRHLLQSLKDNVISKRHVGYIKRPDGYYHANADGARLVASDRLIGGNDPERNLFTQLAMDSILENRVVVLLNNPGPIGYANYIKEVLDSPDVPSAMMVIAKHKADRAAHRQEYANARAAGAAIREIPDELMAVVDGKLIDLIYGLPSGIKLQAVDQSTGELIRHSTFTWRPMPQAVATVQQHVGKGRCFLSKK